MLRRTLEKIQERVHYYNEMDELLAVFKHHLISDEIQGLFGQLDECLCIFSFAADVAQAQWIDEFLVVQGQEARDIRRVQGDLSKMNASFREINQKEDQFLERREKITDSLQDIASSTADKTSMIWNEDTESASCVEDEDEVISVQGAFNFLVSRGCPDLSMRMDVNQQDAVIVNGGGFGNIWMAKLCDGNKVSIKTWRASTVDECDRKTLMRALREIHAWSQMKHQNIHQLVGVIMFKGSLIGMVSEWMENGNLREYMLKHPQLDRHQMCVQIANGLAYMHRCNTVHGDLKAMNVLVSPKGVAMLTDFGSSVMTEASLEYSVTNTTLSVRWAAPEQLDGSPKNWVDAALF
ncbi:unnamed protein product [Rhizoctonia solani]|nr:unnamed protein product [Rhizoctonia solani]